MLITSQDLVFDAWKTMLCINFSNLLGEATWEWIKGPEFNRIFDTGELYDRENLPKFQFRGWKSPQPKRRVNT